MHYFSTRVLRRFILKSRAQQQQQQQPAESHIIEFSKCIFIDAMSVELIIKTLLKQLVHISQAEPLWNAHIYIFIYLYSVSIWSACRLSLQNDFNLLPISI